MEKYASVLRHCNVLHEGRRIHQQLKRSGIPLQPSLAASIVKMYTKCGSLEDAQTAFEEAAGPKTFSKQLWSSIFGAYAKLGNGEVLTQGRELHLKVPPCCKGDMIMETSIVNMYAKCGSLDEARSVFDTMVNRDVITFTSMIVAYAQSGHFEAAYDLYRDMDTRGVQPNNQTFASLLSVCNDLQLGRSLHKRIVECNVQRDVILDNSLVNMYAKCGCLDESRKLFGSMSRKNVGSWNVMIGALVNHELHDEALQLYRTMDVAPNVITYISILGSCCSPEALEQGREIHNSILSSGKHLQRDAKLQNAILSMYAKCGSLEDARRIFDSIEVKCIYSWAGLISGYVQQGYWDKALEMFERMKTEGGIAPDAIGYTGAVQACGGLGLLEKGRILHEEIVARGMETECNVVSALILMYARCGSPEESMRVFKVFKNGAIHHTDPVIWTVFMSSLVQQDQGDRALALLREMELEGVKPNNVTFSRAIAACSNVGDLKRLHARIDGLGMIDDDKALQETLFTAYIKCGSLSDASRIFEKIGTKDAFSWTAMISSSNQKGFPAEAMRYYKAMDAEPDEVTFLNVLSACSSLGDLQQGREVHDRIVSRGFKPSASLQTGLVSMYAKCGCLNEAKKVLQGMEDVDKDVVSWTSLISSFIQLGCGEFALELFRKMVLNGVMPNSVTFCCILGGCASIGSLKDGLAIHKHVQSSGCFSDVSVENAVLNMYAKCGRIDLAKAHFDSNMVKNSVTWSIMVGANVQHGYAKEALEIFYKMDMEGLEVDRVVFLAIFGACSILEDLQRGRAVYDRISARGDLWRSSQLQNAAMNMFARCGSLDEAKQVFDGMDQHARTVVSWTTMIFELLQHGRYEESLQLFEAMDLEPAKHTFNGALNACACLGALEKGKDVHAKLFLAGFGDDEVLTASLVNMYAKCGSLSTARQIFEEGLSTSGDVISWNVMLTSYSQLSYKEQVVELLWRMRLLGVEPNGITFINVLVLCSQGGLLEECMYYFESMVIDHGLRPQDEHYSCMIDLLGRIGRLDAAEKVLSKAPLIMDSSVWMSFLGACRTHNDMQRATRAAAKLQEIQPGDTAPYVLLAQIHST